MNRFKAIAEPTGTEALNICQRNIMKFLGKLNPDDPLEPIPGGDEQHTSLSRPIVQKCVARVVSIETAQYFPDQFWMSWLIEIRIGNARTLNRKTLEFGIPARPGAGGVDEGCFILS